MAASLVALSDFATWTGLELDAAAEDQLANLMIQAASEKVRSTASQPLWTVQNAPLRARQIATHLAVRSYQNPEAVEREGNLGPLGGDQRVREFAMTLHLTQAETIELLGLAPESVQSAGSALWVQPLHVSVPLPTDIVIGNVVYADQGDAYAFTPLEA